MRLLRIQILRINTKKCSTHPTQPYRPGESEIQCRKNNPRNYISMADANKRSRQDASQVSRKKQKIELPSKSKLKGCPTPNLDVVVPDQLAWKEVTLPDRFDDAEGFFGLEEIDNVEVVRDAAKRTVQYRVGKMIRVAQLISGTY